MIKGTEHRALQKCSYFKGLTAAEKKLSVCLLCTVEIIVIRTEKNRTGKNKKIITLNQLIALITPHIPSYPLITAHNPS